MVEPRYVTGGYVSMPESGERLAQVIAAPECAKSNVYWSWNGGAKTVGIKAYLTCAVSFTTDVYLKYVDLVVMLKILVCTPAFGLLRSAGFYLYFILAAFVARALEVVRVFR